MRCHPHREVARIPTRSVSEVVTRRHPPREVARVPTRSVSEGHQTIASLTPRIHRSCLVNERRAAYVNIGDRRPRHLRAVVSHGSSTLGDRGFSSSSPLLGNDFRNTVRCRKRTPP